MNIRIRLLLDLLRMIPRTPYKLRKILAIFGHVLCGGITSRRLFQSQCPYPLHAVLLATTRCNKRCPDCFYTRLVNKPNATTELTLELVKEAFDTKLFQSVCRAALVGGEPLLNTGFWL